MKRKVIPKEVCDIAFNLILAIAFIVIFAREAAVIIIGNVFTIFAFKTQSGLHPKRTCLPLINLAVTDLIVGEGEVITWWSIEFRELKADP